MAFLTAQRKVILSGMLGNGLEWYDYALYGHMSIVFATLFFPAGDQSHNLILTLLIFAVGFLARPLGAILFGRLGDTYGRKKALVASMILMAIPTGCIGLLPTYDMVGMAAPILLLILRVAQGLSLGGAYSGSVSYVVEHAPAERRSTIGSLIKISLIIGFLLGSLMSTVTSSLLTESQFHSWGWRLPFFFGVLIGLVGFYIRQHGTESPVYEAAKTAGLLSPNPVRDTFFKHPTKILQAFMAYLFVTVPFYLIAIYMIPYSKTHLGLTETQALTANTISMASMLLLIYPAARMGDRIGRRPVQLSAIITMIAVAHPAFKLMHSGNLVPIIIALCVMAMIIGWYLATIPAMLVEIFPTSIRNTGMSLSYNLCAILGGFAPSLAEYMIKRTGDTMSIQWLMIGAGALTFLSLLFYKDRWRDPLPA